MIKNVKIKIFGFVQGVFFRANAQEIAQKLGLKGFVKNESDSSVKIVAEGKEEKLKELISWCWQGPSRAQVEKVEVKWEESEGKFKDFEIRY